jgi:hypothetical protein
MSLSIGVSSLPQAEAALIGTILRLSSQLAGIWQISERSDCDVLMVDPSKAGLSWTNKQFETQILVPIGSYFLERPFRAERFIALLMRLEIDLKARSIQVPGSTIGSVPRVPIDERKARLARWPLGEMARTDVLDLRMMTMLSARAYSAAELAKLTGRTATRSANNLHGSTRPDI